jgi:putative transposase
MIESRPIASRSLRARYRSFQIAAEQLEINEYIQPFQLIAPWLRAPSAARQCQKAQSDPAFASPNANPVHRITNPPKLPGFWRSPVAELCRKHGMSDATFYKWKSKYGGLEVSEAKRLRALEAENTKLKRLLADAMLDNAALKDLLGKKW